MVTNRSASPAANKIPSRLAGGEDFMDEPSTPTQPPDNSTAWLKEILDRIPEMPPDEMLRDWRKGLESVYFNRGHVLQAISSTVSAAKSNQEPIEITAAKTKALIADERGRAAWQSSRKCLWLGIELMVALVALMTLGVVAVANRHLGGWAVHHSVVLYAWSGAIGGATMALYGFTHGFLYRDVTPFFWWWSVTKPAFGAVTGLVTAGLVYVGLISVKASDPSNMMILLCLFAFAAGFKEQWFLGWLGQLKPRTQTSTPPGTSGPTTPR